MTTPQTVVALRDQQTPEVMDALTAAVLNGDMKGLPPETKIEYYNAVCHAVGIDPMQHPFEYIPVKGGKEKLYWTAVGAFTLNAMQGGSVTDDGAMLDDDNWIARATAAMPGGRQATNIGVVYVGPTSRWDSTKRERVAVPALDGQDLADARMKAVTKAQRRACLSLSGMTPCPGIVTNPASGEITVDPRIVEVPALEHTGNARALREGNAGHVATSKLVIRPNVAGFINGLSDLESFTEADFTGLSMNPAERKVLLDRAAQLGIGWHKVTDRWAYVKASCGDCGDEMDHPGQLVDGICALCAAEQAGIPATPDEPDDPASGVPAAAELDTEAAAEAADQADLPW